VEGNTLLGWKDPPTRRWLPEEESTPSEEGFTPEPRKDSPLWGKEITPRRGAVVRTRDFSRCGVRSRRMRCGNPEHLRVKGGRIHPAAVGCPAKGGRNHPRCGVVFRG
jgi:hypothetical protein